MAINFPSGPSDGQLFTTSSGIIYSYSSSIGAWQVFSTANTTTQAFVADGSTSTYLLSSVVGNQNNLLVTLDGIVQAPAVHYTVTGYTLLFSAPPPASSYIEVRNIEKGSGNAPVVNYIFSPFLLMGV